MSHPLFEKHRETLTKACDAIARREFFARYPEIPSGKIYGETARDDGRAAFEARLNKPFKLEIPGSRGTVGAERSPYGLELGITYPKSDPDTLVRVMREGLPAWRDAEPETRIGICLEILERLNRRSFELALAVMHTTGQAFMMAFQAGGPHAQDRGLEAVAQAYDVLKEIPADVQWKKQVGKDKFETIAKHYRAVPRGIAAVVGCSTFPTWNSYPAIFANLATGNAAIVKPHPNAVLPLAITVEIGREVLSENGFDANVLTLLADDASEPVTAALVTHPDIHIVDYTGGTEFGTWIEKNAGQAVVFTEKAGVNSIVIDSVDNLDAAAGNIAFSICLYSGQMCTTPQNIYIPRDGITAGGEKKSFEEVAAAITGAVDRLLKDPARGCDILGAIASDRTLERINEATADGTKVLRSSESMTHPEFPNAVIRSPVMLKVGADQEKTFMREMFGPIVYFVETPDAETGLELARRCATEVGSITAAVYSTRAEFVDNAAHRMAEAGVPLFCNLAGHVLMNHSAAFSDFHVSGLNPSGNATLCDNAYVANRFRIAQTCVQA